MMSENDGVCVKVESKDATIAFNKLIQKYPIVVVNNLTIVDKFAATVSRKIYGATTLPAVQQSLPAGKAWAAMSSPRRPLLADNTFELFTFCIAHFIAYRFLLLH
jgi:hypothetical protein